MSRESSLAKNTLYSAASAASNIVMVVLVILAARELGDEAFGLFSFALALASIFEMLIDMGLTTLTTRNVSRDRSLAGAYLTNILSWKAILSVVAMGLLILATNLMEGNRDARIASYILGASVVLRTYQCSATGFFQAFERFDLILVVFYIERIGMLIAGVLVLIFMPSLIAFSAVFVLVRIPDVIITYWLIHRKITPIRLGFDFNVVKKLQLAALPFGTYALVAAMYAYIGTLFLASMHPPREVGWYNAGSKIYEGFAMFPYLITATLLPRLSRLFTSDRERHKVLSLKALRYLTLGSIPLAAAVGILAPQIIDLLYEDIYMPAVPILRLLLIATIPMFANMLLNTMLISANKEGSVLKVAACGLLILTSANLILTQRFGAIGTAYSVVTSESCVFIILLTTAGKVLFPIPAHKIAWRPVLACASSAAVLYVFRMSAPGILAILFIALYIAALFALRALTIGDLAALKSLFPSRDTPRQ